MSGGGRAVWRQRLKRDPVAGHGTAGRDLHPSARASAAIRNGSRRMSRRSYRPCRQARQYAFGTARTLRERVDTVAIGTLWRFFKRSQDPRVKKSLYAAEQRRSAVDAVRARRGSKGTRPRSDADRLHPRHHRHTKLAPMSRPLNIEAVADCVLRIAMCKVACGLL